MGCTKFEKYCTHSKKKNCWNNFYFTGSAEFLRFFFLPSFCTNACLCNETVYDNVKYAFYLNVLWEGGYDVQ